MKQYEYKIRDAIIKLALIKPPKTLKEKKGKKLIKNMLIEYGII